MDELLSLKWNNHCSTFLQILGAVRNKRKYTDVTLACSGKFYAAHKLVLSTCSDYFEEIFSQSDGKNLVVVLKDISSQDLELLLDYMYLGEVSVKQTDLSTLIKAAECLQIKGLAVADDEETPHKPSKTSNQITSSPSVRQKRKLQDMSDQGNAELYVSNKQKRLEKQSSYSPVDIVDPLEDIESIIIKEEAIPYEPETISVDDVCKDEFSQFVTSDDKSNIPAHPPESADSREQRLDSSAVETAMEDNGTYSGSSFQGEPSEWPNDDSNLTFPSSSEYGPPETSGQTVGVGRHNGFTCSYCPKIFQHQSWLALHIRTHTGERPFSCTLCPYSAKQKGSLKTHFLLRHKTNFK